MMRTPLIEEGGLRRVADVFDCTVRMPRFWALPLSVIDLPTVEVDTRKASVGTVTLELFSTIYDADSQCETGDVHKLGIASYVSWLYHPGRFRSLGGGQLNWHEVFGRMAKYDFPGCAGLEQKYALAPTEVGAAGDAPVIDGLRVSIGAFANYIESGSDQAIDASQVGFGQKFLARSKLT